MKLCLVYGPIAHVVFAASLFIYVSMKASTLELGALGVGLYGVLALVMAFFSGLICKGVYKGGRVSFIISLLVIPLLQAHILIVVKSLLGYTIYDVALDILWIASLALTVWLARKEARTIFRKRVS